MGELREGMGHILESFDCIWNGIYDFNWYKVYVLTKEFEMPNYNLISSENIDVEVNFGTVLLKMKVNRFLK
jgi:hypothetical protein